MTMTLSRLIDSARSILSKGGFTASEMQWMIRDIFSALKGWSQVDILTKGDDEVTPWLTEKVTDAATRVAGGEPLQYVLGQAHFMGLTFQVNPSTLIPRPETEQLVDMAVERAGGRTDLRVKDIGTGSGCIAISLARALKFPVVEATDISAAALETARTNARDLRVKVDFKEEDILSAVPPSEAYDIIVSNPPYIAEKEKADMEANVLLHEPHTALFVPDDDPLKFYRAIGRYAARALTADGDLWLEINPLYADTTRAEIAAAGFMTVELIRDERGLQRFIHARRNRV